jgi:hypothetical protein
MKSIQKNIYLFVSSTIKDMCTYTMINTKSYDFIYSDLLLRYKNLKRFIR